MLSMSNVMKNFSFLYASFRGFLTATNNDVSNEYCVQDTGNYNLQSIQLQQLKS